MKPTRITGSLIILKKRIQFFFVLIFLTVPLFSQNVFDLYFQDCNVFGSVVLFDSRSGEYLITDSLDSTIPTLPASTFKIINTLIALQEEVISSINDTIKFNNRDIDTTFYGHRPNTYFDVTISEAFKKSIVWVYQDISKQINNKVYLDYLNKIKYGNGKIDSELIDFWNYGEFKVSPIQQIELLKMLYYLDLPFDKINQLLVKELMFNEFYYKTKVYGKTGWTRTEDYNIGWWIGFFEFENGPLFFVTRIKRPIVQGSEGFAKCRKKITYNILDLLEEKFD